MTTDWASHELRQQAVARPDVQTLASRILCRCGARDGWARLENEWDDDLWVCPRCGGPSYMAEEKRMGLAFFRGGPLDGRAYEVATLTRDLSLGPYIIQYNWTPEIITSEQTGATARVWQHKELPGETARLDGAAAALPPEQPVASDTESEREGDTSMADTEAAVVTSGLLDRRTALKASRTDVQKISGLTVPQVARIEQGGARTTADEVKSYTDALDAIEQQGGAGRERKAKKTAAASEDAKEGGDTKGPKAPPPSSAPAAETDTGGVVRLHEWNGFSFTPRQKGDMTGGSPVKWSASTSAAFTFVAFTRDDKGTEVVELWETRRRRIRYAKPEDITAPRTRRRKAS